MPSPFLYLVDGPLSHAELTAARLDGDLFEVGEAFMPADAVETAELRAASLRPIVPPGVALTHGSAAWVHGAVSEPPARHTVQRSSARRVHHVLDHRLTYRDLRVPPSDVVSVGGVPVTRPARTLADMVRDDVGRGCEAGPVARALAASSPGLASAAVALLESAGPVTHKRAALAWLRRRAAYDEVTR